MAKTTKKAAAKKAPAKKAKAKAAKKPASKAGKKPAAKAAKKGGSKKPLELIISKSRTKNAAAINVSGEFYGALDAAVREIIAGAEARAMSNGRKTLRPHDL
jgi:histone H3/H4